MNQELEKCHCKECTRLLNRAKTMHKFHCVIVLENSLKGTIISIIVWSIG